MNYYHILHLFKSKKNLPNREVFKIIIFSKITRVKLCRHFFQHSFITFLIKSSDSSGSNFQSNPATFFRYPNPFLLKIRQESSSGLVMCMRNVISRQDSNTCQFTSSCHFYNPFVNFNLNKLKSTQFFDNYKKILAINDIFVGIINYSYTFFPSIVLQNKFSCIFSKFLSYVWVFYQI